MLTELQSFLEAFDFQTRKVLFPNGFSTEELRLIEAAFRRQATFSARLDLAQTVQRIQDVTEAVLNPHTVDGRTEGMDFSTAILELKKSLEAEGYQPSEEDRGTLRDHSSFARRKLIVKTNVEMAQGVGHHLQSHQEEVLEAYPCQELVRFEGRKLQRDWRARWEIAARASGDTDAARVASESGRMVARKDSPIWDSLGDSGLFDDGLDNPFPPFAFNSGMWVVDVDYEEAVGLGIIQEGDVVGGKPLEFKQELELPDSLKNPALRELVLEEEYSGSLEIDLSGRTVLED